MVHPAARTLPGDGRTRFKFDVSITCQAPGTGAIAWSATTAAPENRDMTNDTLTGRTSVTCR
jgi:hypothetical protein